jgi:hypothetical protein
MDMKQTKPLSISNGPMKIDAGVWIGSLELPILGPAVIMQLDSTLNISKGKVTWQIGQLQGSTVQNHPIGTTKNNECGTWVWNQCA